MKGYRFELEIMDTDDNDEEYPIFCKGEISRFIPATMYRSNGDPGDPEEGDELEFSEEPYFINALGKPEEWTGDFEWLEDQIRSKVDTCERNNYEEE